MRIRNSDTSPTSDANLCPLVDRPFTVSFWASVPPFWASKVLHTSILSLHRPRINFDADPDPTFDFDVDPDPDFDFDADPDWTFSFDANLKILRIHANLDPQH